MHLYFIMTKSNQYCLDILELGVFRNKATVNVVMSLASQPASSVTELSLNPLFHYQYSSITDGISHLVHEPSSYESTAGSIRRTCLRYFEPQEMYLLQTDKTSLCKPHSPTLEERTMVHVPNQVIPGNKPLDIGYEYSFVNLHDPLGRWSLPLSARRIPLDKKPGQVAAEQVQQLWQEESLPFAQAPLVVNGLDSGYTSPAYLDRVKQLLNLVSIVRLRQGTKVWEQAGAGEENGTGSKKTFGAKYYLQPQSQTKLFHNKPKEGGDYEVYQRSITEKEPDGEQRLHTSLRNGRQVEVRLRRWNGFIWRTKDHCPMEDKPFDILCVEVIDPGTGKPVFKDPMFLAAFGHKRKDLSSQDIYRDYVERYGIEPFFRFVKQKMFMQDFYTSMRDHLDNWMLVITLSVWLLFTARSDVKNQPKKWQRYLPVEKAGPQQVLSMAQTYKAVLPLLLTFDQLPFLPHKSKPGPGRQKGMTQAPRKKYPYVKKQTASPPKNRSPVGLKK